MELEVEVTPIEIPGSIYNEQIINFLDALLQFDETIIRAEAQDQARDQSGKEAA